MINTSTDPSHRSVSCRAVGTSQPNKSNRAYKLCLVGRNASEGLRLLQLRAAARGLKVKWLCRYDDCVDLGKSLRVLIADHTEAGRSSCSLGSLLCFAAKLGSPGAPVLVPAKIQVQYVSDRILTLLASVSLTCMGIKQLLLLYCIQDTHHAGGPQHSC